MPPVGPQLPSSNPAKRHHPDEDVESDSESSSSPGPALPVPDEPPTKKARVVGPTLPPTLENDPPLTNQEPSPDFQENSSNSDEDDDFGPALPTSDVTATNVPTESSQLEGALNANHLVKPPKRDDWMMVPPSGGDWTARVDPTKLKNRKFNTGKGAKAAPSAGNAENMWHETPAEKQARLQREMMGIQDKSHASSTTTGLPEDKVDMETAKRMQEYQKSRGPTLYRAHQEKQTVEQDDDPSARAFDREKDIGGGLQINSTRRREMLKKASDFNSRFSNAKYL